MNGERSEFNNELETLINKHAIDNLCHIPDFILANMVEHFVINVGHFNKQILDWHGCDSICHPKRENL